MLKKIKNIIRHYQQAKREKKKYTEFLSFGTNTALQDNINNIPRPSKSFLRILGNGNSLISVVDNLSSDYDYMVLNSHILHPSYFEIKPIYYVLADPAFFVPRKNYDGTNIVKKILLETNWKMTLFVPWEFAHKVNIKSTQWVTIRYVNQSLYKGPEQYRTYLYEHNLAMPNVNNVLASAIYLSIYLGYAKVELYGVEHSWTKYLYVNKNNQTCIKDSHFYDNKEVEDNIITDVKGKPMKFHEVLKLYADYFPAYWELRQLADMHNCRIINMTSNSFIDAFERQ